MPGTLPHRRWSLTPPFHPYLLSRRYHFCCTILRVTSTGRYPASCPVKPGLSSRPVTGAGDCSFHSNFHFLFCRRKNMNNARCFATPSSATRMSVIYVLAVPASQEIRYHIHVLPSKLAVHVCNPVLLQILTWCYTLKILPPINSLISEFFGTSSQVKLTK